MSTDPALERFAGEVARGEALDLDRAALVMALHARPDLDVEEYLCRLDDLAARAGRAGVGPVATIASLFGGDGLRGNEEEYYDPRNSLLHEVLDRGLGIPISLAVIAIEVGRRLGIDVEGVPFPGHFLVRVRGDGEPALLDVFQGGAVLSDAEVLLRLRAVTGRIGSLGPAELGRASKSQILARMLQNLKVIYFRADDLLPLLAIQERLIVLLGGAPAERRDRGLLLARLGRDDEAEADLEAYLAASTGPPDRDEVRTVLELIRARQGPVH